MYYHFPSNMLLLSTEGTSGHCALESLPAKRHDKTRRDPDFTSCCYKGVGQSKHMPGASPQEQRAQTALPLQEQRVILNEEEKRACHAARTSPEHSGRWMMCTNAQRPMGPGKARRLPKRARPTSFAKSSRQRCCRPLRRQRADNNKL